jgi:hypothetical protein
MWQCSNCGEEVGNDFEICWNCETEKGNSIAAGNATLAAPRLRAQILFVRLAEQISLKLLVRKSLSEVQRARR